MKDKNIFRKIHISIRTKLTVLINLLLLVSLSFYIFYAIDLFKKDKSAFIYESSLLQSESLSGQYELTLEFLINQIDSLGDSFSNVGKEASEKLFEKSAHFLEFAIFIEKKGLQKQLFGIRDKKYQRNKLINFSNDKFIQSVMNKSKMGGTAYASRLNDNAPEIVISRYNKINNTYYVARSSISNIVDLIQGNTNYQSIIIDAQKKYILHSNLNNLNKPIHSQISTLINKLREKNLSSGVRSITINKIKILIAFNYLPRYDSWVIIKIPESDAFKATSYLINKSLYFGLFILSTSIIIGILFSKGLSNPIQRLFAATKEITAGNFNQKVNINTNDEIGVLADSFNYMSKEITRYMVEMEEKLRLEKEVEVAQLVQTSFFPPSHINYPNLQIAAYYKPASECGGDWWGELHYDDLTITMIADATGHGVPAALLTATAYCCMINLKEVAKYSPAILKSPAKILDFFNKAVCSTSDKILMTCFVTVLDHNTNELTYANASHNPTLHYCSTADEPTKNDFKSLIGETGPHLGKNIDFIYSESKTICTKGDSLVLYTDGIIECTNNEDTQWGNRRFLKSLMANIKSPAFMTEEKIIQDAFEFYDGKLNNDDITLVILKVD